MPKTVDIEMLPPFAGVPKEGVAFLRDLKKNNDRDWFQAHKQEFEQSLKFPVQCLIATLGRILHDDFPTLDFNPQKSIFRIYRDTRFSKDKSPYKTNIGAHFTSTSAIGVDMPGLYVHIEPDGMFAGGGIYMPDGKQLRALRESIVAEPDAFLDVISEDRFKELFGSIQGEKLKKSPQGFPADHPMVEHLKHKQFFVGRDFKESSVFAASFAEEVADTFRAILPLMTWLHESLAKG